MLGSPLSPSFSAFPSSLFPAWSSPLSYQPKLHWPKKREGDRRSGERRQGRRDEARGDRGNGERANELTDYITAAGGGRSFGRVGVGGSWSLEAPIKRAVKNNGHPTEAERPADADVGGKGEGRREGDAGARRKGGRTMRTNANAKEVDRENESGGWRVHPSVRLFSTPFATHFRVNKDSRFVKTFVLDRLLLPASKKFASGKRYLKPRTINHFFCLILSSEPFYRRCRY